MTKLFAKNAPKALKKNNLKIKKDAVRISRRFRRLLKNKCMNLEIEHYAYINKILKKSKVKY